ncbi:unnamed protein product [Bemisia tabaci]|uniref:Vacuolar fusion protein MON1 homolog n=1 Tax=Bemisia tabaci TaxID=7038 RepID=A0A9P0F6Z4_BEMTA|nr:PREDICTED: vacuolar fusion protein MON1 homolog A [Bemisia tabaci]CAH0394975.1 unnamed protein product [Bemisia tabaci]
MSSSAPGGLEGPFKFPNSPEPQSSSSSFVVPYIEEERPESPAKHGLDEKDFEKLVLGSDFVDESNVDEDCNVAQELKKYKYNIFVLSSAGKPVYSRYGNEDKLSTLFGVMQVLVSFIQDSNDVLKSIRCNGCTFTFLSKGPLILVSVAKTQQSDTQLLSQLTYVYNQVISVVTLSRLTKIFEQKCNYDLRRLLSGSERLIDQLLVFMETDYAFLLGAVRVLPLAPTARDDISNIIVSACSKIKNLVFALLIANNQLITLVRMKKYELQPSDLHLLFNLVNSSESFKTAESWTPICLPLFNPSGFLHCHVSYLSEDCQACLMLLTVDHDLFYTLSTAKQKIVETLRRKGSLKDINDALALKPISASELGIYGLRHFMCKSRKHPQFWSSRVDTPYDTPEEVEHLMSLYQNLHQHVHHPTRPLKLCYQQMDSEIMLGHITAEYEFYFTFEPLVTKSDAISAAGRLPSVWLKDDEEKKKFIFTDPTF